jgi:hypothetical protein
MSIISARDDCCGMISPSSSNLKCIPSENKIGGERSAYLGRILWNILLNSVKRLIWFIVLIFLSVSTSGN